MKATLLIKNIENLYTCDKNFTILHRAFIACHHDKIIEINTGSYKEWLDPATRVIDAQGECVVPAFIDCQFKSFTHVRLGDQLRQDINALYAMRQNGILTLICDNPNSQRMKLEQDVFYKKNQPKLPVLHRLNELNDKIKKMGGEVVGINTDTLDDNQDGIKEAKDILKSQGVSYKNLTFASDSTVGKYAGNIIAFPPTVLVDKSGNIISEPFMGGIDDQANYEQLMKQIQSILDQE